LKRKIIDELINWKTQNSGKPILLTGAKGVGKTYLAYDFAKAFFEGISYLNFERDPKAVSLFHEGMTDKAADRLAKYFHVDLEQPVETRILILDEIGYNSEVLKLLETVDLSSVFRYLIYISSNPVPSDLMMKVTNLSVYPLEFDEFLLATGNEWYIESIITHYNNDRKIPDIVHKELLALHQLYLQIGGMPGLVNEYLNLASTVNVAEQHSFLTGSYHDYIIRDNTDSEALKINQVFDSLVLQLMKENKKFQYKLIRKGTTHSMYKDAIQKLCDYNYIIKCNRISNEQLIDPVQTFYSKEWLSIDENTNFKLYMPDTGLLYSKITEEQGISLEPEHRKALLENYVAQSLRSKNFPFAFWESESMAKVDFIFLKDKVMLPLEIFENDNTRSKSISVLKQKCNFPHAVKISSKNFEFSNGIKYVPYYAVFCL
jgi:predicted AAA+ superfamily ATPase